jgi:hypothetical protein
MAMFEGMIEKIHGERERGRSRAKGKRDSRRRYGFLAPGKFQLFQAMFPLGKARVYCIKSQCYYSLQPILYSLLI